MSTSHKGDEGGILEAVISTERGANEPQIKKDLYEDDKEGDEDVCTDTSTFIRETEPYSDSKGEQSNVNIALRTNQMQQGSTLSFHDINYVVEKKKYGYCGQKTTKDILIHVNGICRPGMNAILGTTGSGKTSLLNVLAGRKDPNGLSGQLLMDGKPIPQNFKCMVGYVLQDDAVMDTLTVRENLMFSANLRLPSSYKSSARVHRVEELIQELSLTECANTKNLDSKWLRRV